MQIFLGFKGEPALLHKVLKICLSYVCFCPTAKYPYKSIKSDVSFAVVKRVSDFLKVTQFVLAKPELDRISWLPI